MARSGFKKLGDYIEQIDVRNSSDLYGEGDVKGISTNKCFMQTRGNLIGVSFTNYKIVSAGQFAFNINTARMGDRFAIALREDEPCIVSSIYVVFQTKEGLLPEYLYLWCSRPEFDRYVRFMSHGSAREIFDWDDMCEVEIPIPSTDVQEKVVEQYRAIKKRIENNQRLIFKLESTIQTLYRKSFVDDLVPENLPDGWEKTTLEALSDLIVAGTIPEYVESGSDLVLGQKCIADHIVSLEKARYHKPKSNCRFLKYGDILINSTGDGTLGRVGQVSFHPERLAYDSNMTLVRPSKDYYVDFLFEFLKTKEDYFVNISQGSTNQTRLYCSMVRPLEVILPPENLLRDFQHKVDQLTPEKRLLEREIPLLKNLLELLQSRLSTLS